MIYYPRGFINKYDTGQYVYQKVSRLDEDSGNVSYESRRKIRHVADMIQFEEEHFFPIKNTPFIEAALKGGKKGPPLLVRANTSLNCIPGERRIGLVFSYFDGAEWHTVKEIVTVRVKGWFERNRWLLIAAAVLGAVVAIGSLIISALASFGIIP